MAFIPIDRNIFDHAFWTERREYSRFEAWMDLVKSAHYEIEPFRLKVNDQYVIVNRGQFAASIRFLMERWGWLSTGKVKRYLDELETERMIERKTERKATIITLCKYDVYNPLKSDDGTQTDTQTERKRNADGTKNNKVINKKRNKEDMPTDKPPAVSEPTLFSFFLKEYNEFLLRETESPEMFSVGGRKNLKDIVSYMKATIVILNERANITQDEKTIEGRALDGWKYVLNNYKKWDPFHQGQLKLEQIRSNLTNILNSIKKYENGKSGINEVPVTKIAGIKNNQAANFLEMEITVERRE